MNPDERISFDTCGISPSTPVESPLPTDSQNPSSTPVESSPPTDTTSNVGVTVSSVVGAVLGNLAVLIMVIAVIALIMTCRKHRKTKQKLKY